MQIIINIVIIAALLYIIYKILQLKKLYEAFDMIIIRFMKGVVESRDDDKKLVDIFGKLIEKFNKAVFNMSVIQKEIDNLKRAAISFNQLNNTHNENVNFDGRTMKESINSLNFKLSDLNTKANKISSTANKLDAVVNRFEKLEKNMAAMQSRQTKTK